MKHVAAECPRCGATITPEEIEVGISLVCPRCKCKQDKAGKSADPDQPDCGCGRKKP